MGTVYFAKHLGTSRPVAIKIISPDLMTDPTIVERFKREARAAGQLRHPNVVNVTDFGITCVDGEPVAYLVMEHLEGLTLADLLEEEGSLPLPRVVDILRQTCAAVEEAHRHGIIHRDLKPENIWLEPRSRSGYAVKVLDFGVAKLRELPDLDPAPPAADDGAPLLRVVDPAAETLAVSPTSGPRTIKPIAVPEGADEGITGPGALLGTPLYMSPEQWMNRGVDVRSDVYSLGVIAYQMLTGEVPFSGRTSSISMQHLRDAPLPLAEKAPDVPPAVAGVVMAALAKSPTARPPSALHFATVLAAGAERTGAVLSRAMVLCATHFTSLFGVVAMALAPALLACALRLSARILVDAGALPAAAGVAISLACLVVYMLGVALLPPVAAALITPRVRDALVGPHDAPRARPSLEELATCLRKTVTPTLIVMAAFLLIGGVTRQPLFLLAQHVGLFPEGANDLRPIEVGLHFVLETPGFVVFALVGRRYVGYPSVAAVEGLGGLQALGRAAALTQPMRRTAAATLGLHMAVRYLVLWFCWLSLAQIARVPCLEVIDVLKDSIISNVSLLLVLSLECVGWTFTLTAMALVYLNGRQIEGVTLETMSEPAAAEAPPGAAPASRHSTPVANASGVSPPPHSTRVRKPAKAGRAAPRKRLLRKLLPRKAQRR
jgi:hypothetical protein